jgi:lipopolysaccharide transport system permease protein
MRFINESELFLLEEVVKRNFSAKYKDSALGILWTVFKPLLIMVLLTIIFSTMFSRSIENYPVYMLSGRCIYDCFSSSISSSLTSIKNNKNILQKTGAPKHIFVLGAIISEFINLGITFVILLVVMLATKAPFDFMTIPFAIIPIISLAIMVTGLGFMLSIFNVYYTDVGHLWSVFVMMLMYSLAIFYPMDMVPEPFRFYLCLNPLYWIIDQFRCFVYMQTLPSVLNIVNSLLFSSILLVLGLIVFKKYESKVLMKL